MGEQYCAARTVGLFSLNHLGRAGPSIKDSGLLNGGLHYFQALTCYLPPLLFLLLLLLDRLLLIPSLRQRPSLRLLLRLQPQVHRSQALLLTMDWSVPPPYLHEISF